MFTLNAAGYLGVGLSVVGAALSAGTIAETSHGSTTAVLASIVAAAGGTAPRAYQYQRKEGAGAYGNVSGATSAGLSDSGLTPETTYTWKRTVTDAVLDSADSNEVTITTNAIVLIPSGFPDGPARIGSRTVRPARRLEDSLGD